MPVNHVHGYPDVTRSVNDCSFYSGKSKIRYLQGLCLTSRGPIMHMVRAFPFYLNITSTGGRADTALAEAEASRESIQ